VVYLGRVSELLEIGKPINPMKGSPAYAALEKALKKIAPLNLIDPKDEHFNPESCRTIHDIIRFAHEMAMQEMFQIGDILEDDACGIPLLPGPKYLRWIWAGVHCSKGKEVRAEEVHSISWLF
jgi:pyruvate,water dikinase